MKRWPLVGTLAAATAISLAAAWREVACQSCSGGLPLGILGSAFYACAAITVAVFGLRRPLAMALFGASGLHVGLVLLMITRGPFCTTCLVTAGLSAVVTVLALVRHRDLIDLAVAVAPWTATLAFVLPVHPAVREIEVPSTPGAPVQIAVYTREGCPYCAQLRDEVLPAALAGLDRQVEVRWINAPPPARVPSLVLSRADHPGGRFIEGLPPADFLRGEIAKLLAVSP